MKKNSTKTFIEPTIKLEYSDTTQNFFNVATESFTKNFVSNCKIVLSGDVTASGYLEIPAANYQKYYGSSVNVVLSDLITRKTPTHTFLFVKNDLDDSARDYNFNLTIPNDSDYSVMNFRMNRQQTSEFGSGSGYEFKFYAPANNVDTFSFGYNAGAEFNPVYQVSNDGKTFNFNGYRLTGGLEPIQRDDFATKSYVDKKIKCSIKVSYKDFTLPIDIENNTYGQLKPGRLFGFPNDKKFLLKGDGNWGFLTLKDLMVNDNFSLKGFRLTNVGQPLALNDATTVQFVEQAIQKAKREIIEELKAYFTKT